jgi:hypothetical protein
MMRILIVISALVLSACNSTQGLSVFSLSESQAEATLTKQLPKLSERMSLIGLPVQFDVNAMSVKIGPDNRDVVALSVDSSAEVKAFAFTYPVRLGLQIEGSPFYDSEKKAIFLRNLTLLDSSIDAAGFKGNLGVLNGEAMSLINAFLAVNPVYKLDTSDPTMAMLSRLPLNIQVVEGAIKLVPRL